MHESRWGLKAMQVVYFISLGCGWYFDMLGIFPGSGVNVLLSFLFSKLRDLLFCFSCKWYLEIRSRGTGLRGKKCGRNCYQSQMLLHSSAGSSYCFLVSFCFSTRKRCWGMKSIPKLILDPLRALTLPSLGNKYFLPMKKEPGKITQEKF